MSQPGGQVLEVKRDREVKVRIPNGLYVALHATKVLHGKGISEQICEALHQYFEQFAKDAPRP